MNTFSFKVDGGKLTGTVAGTQDQTPIQNAKINGDDISFTAERPFGTFTYSGKVSGTEIKFKVTFNDQSFEMTAKRELKRERGCLVLAAQCGGASNLLPPKRLKGNA